jgi:hypothetical protein
MRNRAFLALALAAAVLAATAGSAAGADSAKGHWIGRASVGSFSFEVRLNITALSPGPAGAVAYSRTPCHGTLRYGNKTNGRYYFRYHEQSSDSRCTHDDIIAVRLRSDHKLAFKDSAQGVSATGVLHRPS